MSERTGLDILSISTEEEDRLLEEQLNFFALAAPLKEQRDRLEAWILKFNKEGM